MANPILIPEFERLLATLNASKDLQKSNPALYQVIKTLINQITQFAKAITPVVESNSEANTVLADRTYLTTADEVPYLPFSRELLAGLNITFDDTNPGERIVNASGSPSSIGVGGIVPGFDGNDGQDGFLINNNLYPVKRVVTVADAVAITPNSNSTDVIYQLNTQVSSTLTINADIGAPSNCQSLTFKIKSTNVQTFAWNAIFIGGTVALPTVTTGSSKIDYFTFTYDIISNKWDFTSSTVGF